MGTAFYIDGFNLYHAIDALKKPHLKWLNLKQLAASFLRQGEQVHSVTYFTALMNHSPEKSQRHRRYLGCLEAYGVDVIQSKFLNSSKYCRRSDRYCDFYEEKQTDVSLAIRAVTDVVSDAITRVVIVTSDSDQVPVVRHIKAAHPSKLVAVVAPPGRRTVARELSQIADEFFEITEGRLAASLLPRKVVNAKGQTFSMPAKYLPPER